MTRRDDILAFADQLLDAPGWKDYGPNGLQVVGADEVTSVASAVSCSLEVFERCAASGAQLLLVHHGLFWRDTPQVVDRFMRARLKALFDHDITLAAYHLPLDGHPTIGNNAIIARELGLERDPSDFVVLNGRPIGVLGRLPEPEPLAAFVARVEQVTGRTPLVLGGEPQSVATVGVCSGGAARQLRDGVAAGVDAYITGEPSEPTMHEAREAGVAFIAAGHYATETFGIRALGDAVAAEFGIPHEFIDSPNPV